MQELRDELTEVLQAVIPIVLVIILLEIFVLQASPADLLHFLLGSGMVVLGIAFFLFGVKSGILPMGEAIGSELPARGSITLIIIAVFFFGFFATVAEPDVRVLTDMVDTVSGGGIAQGPLIVVIGVSVGFFAAVGVLRIVAGVPIGHLFAAGYGLVLLLALITPPEFLAVAFDAGGVTTGPLTVPVILALGAGVSRVLAGRSPITDGFGLIGLASIGPILGVMSMGVIFF